MGQQDLEIKFRIEEMSYYFMTVAYPQFPSSAKRTIGDLIITELSLLLHTVIKVNCRYHKKTSARDIDESLGAIRAWYRSARRGGAMQAKHHQQLSRMMWEIGSMLNRWMAWINNNPPTPARKEEAVAATLPPYKFQ